MYEYNVLPYPLPEGSALVYALLQFLVLYSLLQIYLETEGQYLQEFWRGATLSYEFIELVEHVGYRYV